MPLIRRRRQTMRSPTDGYRVNSHMLIPRLDILPAAQRALWPELSATPQDFTLYGGTAIALRLGHRASADFDFFGRKSFNPDQLLATVPYLADARVLQREENTLTCRVARGGPVLVSFFGLTTIGQIEEPTRVEGTGLKIASLIDLAGMKVSVVQKRAQAKDYIDIDALLTAGISLPSALAAARAIYGRAFEPQITLKALTYFGDGDLPTLPAHLQRQLAVAATAVDLDTLPVLHLLGKSP
jgi:Nucleotidyl transferase AbiEii toxin, Type IV TA system